MADITNRKGNSMTKSLRAVLASCVALLALSLAGSATAAYTICG